MNGLRCMVVDDEELARKLIANYCERLPFVELVASCKNPLEAIQTLRERQVDLLFLDIQMPEMTGLDFLRSLPKSPLTILTTAYAEYALEGYELNVIDYLLKPIRFERFVQAVQKAMDRFGTGAPAGNSEKAPQSARDFLAVKSNYKTHRIYLEDILYIEGMREYVAYHTRQGRIMSLDSMKRLEQSLPADRFLRIHKSYIVSIREVESVEGNMVHIGGKSLPVGGTYREHAFEILL